MCGKESKAQLNTLELYSGVELCFQTIFLLNSPIATTLPLQP